MCNIPNNRTMEKRKSIEEINFRKGTPQTLFGRMCARQRALCGAVLADERVLSWKRASDGPLYDVRACLPYVSCCIYVPAAPVRAKNLCSSVACKPPCPKRESGAPCNAVLASFSPPKVRMPEN